MPPPEQRKPFPDKAHEDLAQWVEETIANLDNNRADTDDSFMLVDILFAMVDEAIAERDAHRIRIDALNIRCDTAIDGMDRLQEQVAALEALHDAQPCTDAEG